MFGFFDQVLTIVVEKKCQLCKIINNRVIFKNKNEKKNEILKVKFNLILAEFGEKKTSNFWNLTKL